MKKIIESINSKAKNLKEKKDQIKNAKSTQTINFIETIKTDKPIEITLSAQTMLKIGLFVMLIVAVGSLVVALQNILILSAISFFVALSLSPILDTLERKFRFPRPLAILFIYLLFFGGLGILFVKIIPILGQQLGAISIDLKNFLQDNTETLAPLQPWLEKININMEQAQIQEVLSKNISQIANNLQGITKSTITVMTDVFQGLFNLLFSLVLIFFILLEREDIGSFFLTLFPKRDQEYLVTKTKTIQEKMSRWIKAQLILMISLGVIMYSGAKIMELTVGMKYSATIGLLSAFMELFPYIGVWVTGFFMIAIALNISWLAVFVSLIVIIIAQFIEGNVLVPLIMEKVIGLSAVATILAISIGGILGNMVGGVPMSILGMLLAVPIAATISIFIDEYAKKDF